MRELVRSDLTQALFMDWLDRNFQTTGGRRALQDQAPSTFHGVRFSYADGAVQLDMPAFIRELVSEVGLQFAKPARSPMPIGTHLSTEDSPRTAVQQLEVVTKVNKMFNRSFRHYSEVVTFYSHLVSSIGWIASKVGPILLLSHSELCRVLSAPSTAAFNVLKRVLRYIAGKPNMHITYKPDRVYDWRHGDWPSYFIQSDASYADDPSDRRSQGGFTGGFRHQAVTTAVSRKGHRIATSTDQAEVQHASSACKHAEYKRRFLQYLGVPMDTPTMLEIDSYSTLRREGAPIRKWSTASKHYDLHEKYLSECVERDVITVQHVPGNLPECPRPGDGFRVDALTKAMAVDATDFYFTALHGPELDVGNVDGGRSKTKSNESDDSSDRSRDDGIQNAYAKGMPSKDA